MASHSNCWSFALIGYRPDFWDWVFKLSAAASNKVYLQLNAFKTAEEADDFQVRIKMIELNPTVESLFLKDKGGQWFVVRLGPLENDDEITRTKALLKGNGYKFAVVLRKS